MIGAVLLVVNALVVFVAVVFYAGYLAGQNSDVRRDRQKHADMAMELRVRQLVEEAVRRRMG